MFLDGDVLDGEFALLSLVDSVTLAGSALLCCLLSVLHWGYWGFSGVYSVLSVLDILFACCLVPGQHFTLLSPIVAGKAVCMCRLIFKK